MVALEEAAVTAAKPLVQVTEAAGMAVDMRADRTVAVVTAAATPALARSEVSFLAEDMVAALMEAEMRVVVMRVVGVTVAPWAVAVMGAAATELVTVVEDVWEVMMVEVSLVAVAKAAPRVLGMQVEAYWVVVVLVVAVMAPAMAEVSRDVVAEKVEVSVVVSWVVAALA